MLQQLLHKETKLLQTIDRLKINANLENKDMRIQARARSRCLHVPDARTERCPAQAHRCAARLSLAAADAG